MKITFSENDNLAPDVRAQLITLLGGLTSSLQIDFSVLKQEPNLESIKHALEVCLEHFHLQQYCAIMDFGMEKNVTPDYRLGYSKAMSHAEAMVGILMLEQGIDLRSAVMPDEGSKDVRKRWHEKIGGG